VGNAARLSHIFLPFEGMPASLRPEAENREWGRTEARWHIAIVC
jgi:hypothetical protein